MCRVVNYMLKGGFTIALILCTLSTLLADERATYPMPRSVDDTPFSSNRDAVTWRRDELKDLERLLRQLRFDLVNNQDARGAAPRLSELQELATPDHLLPAFIEGTYGQGSDARSDIWEEWDEFTLGFRDLEEKVGKLVSAAEQEDYRAATQAFSEVSLSCRSCHRAYRYD